VRHWPLVVVWLALVLSLPACRRDPSGTGPAGTGAPLPPGAIPASATPSSPPPVVDKPTLPPTPVGEQAVPMSFAALAKRSDPAVATVKAQQTRETASGRQRVVAEGLGTAFVYDPDGFLLTNNHVIEDATNIKVAFVDGRELKATVVGRDKHTDVAVVKVEEKNLVALPLGDSDATEVGDWVVAIGNPFGLSHTVSAGILSAKGRTRDDVRGLDPSGYFNFLQTDASINPGNSGGPLMNVKGEVVGINAAVRANANNIGFAIPINMVKQLLPMLLRDGKVQRSAIGVVVLELSDVEAQRLKRPDRKGAWVKLVVPGGPAERAGLAVDDVILSFDGKTINDPNELRWLASIAGVNKAVSLRVARGDRVFDLRLTLGELPAAPEEPNER
jgi:serine protease Do